MLMTTPSNIYLITKLYNFCLRRPTYQPLTDITHFMFGVFEDEHFDTWLFIGVIVAALIFLVSCQICLCRSCWPRLLHRKRRRWEMHMKSQNRPQEHISQNKHLEEVPSTSSFGNKLAYDPRFTQYNIYKDGSFGHGLSAVGSEVVTQTKFDALKDGVAESVRSAQYSATHSRITKYSVSSVLFSSKSSTQSIYQLDEGTQSGHLELVETDLEFEEQSSSSPVSVKPSEENKQPKSSKDTLKAEDKEVKKAPEPSVTFAEAKKVRRTKATTELDSL